MTAAPLGAATIDAAEDRRVRLLKEAGFNAIRSAHNPISRAMLDACDRHGVLVMDELTDVWTQSKTAFDSSLTFPDRWRQDVAALVAKDFNHPSVVLYSIGNEILELATPIGATWSRRLAEGIRELDDTRFVTNGINGVIANMERLSEAMAEVEASDPNTMMANMGEQMARMNASDTRHREHRGVRRGARHRRFQLRRLAIRARCRAVPASRDRRARRPFPRRST